MNSIAPFMANFDASIGGNQSRISYYDNGTHFVCTWNELFLQDQQDAGPFTFQAVLQNNGLFDVILLNQFDLLLHLNRKYLL